MPDCLRTVLASFGLDVSESELRALCDTTIFGTTALKTVDAARALGFTGTAKHSLTLEELMAAVDAGLYPIVFVNLDPDQREGRRPRVCRRRAKRLRHRGL